MTLPPSPRGTLPNTATWLSSVSADWNTPSDWSTDAVPHSTAIAVLISQPGSYTVSISAGESFAVGGVTLDSMSTAASTDTLVVSGGMLAVNGGTVAVHVLQIGAAATGVGFATIADGRLTADTGIIVGNAGTGTLSIGPGGTVTSDDSLEIGYASASQGIVVVNGGTLDVSEFFNAGVSVGFHGAGTLVVENGGVVGLSHTIGVSLIDIGDRGPGVMTINSGRAVDAGAASHVGIGADSGGNGAVTVGSGGTLSSNSIDVSVAVTGTSSGTLTVATGGTVDSELLTEGTGGTITVTGTLNTIGFYIGQVGTGMAVVTVGSLGVLNDNNYATGYSFVGNATAGALTVQTGGTVTGDGMDLLCIQHGGTVTLNGGTLGGYSDIEVGGIKGAPSSRHSPSRPARSKALSSRSATAACSRPAP